MTATERLRRFDWRSAFIASPFAILLAMTFNAIIDRDPPVYYIEAHALQARVAAGDQLRVRFDVDRKRICQVVSIARYVRDKDGIDHAVPTYTANTATRPGREVYDRTITVPETVPPGPASYFLRIKYTCNVIHNLGWPITVNSPMVDFTVLPKLSSSYLPILPFAMLAPHAFD